jgi:mannose-6-phosphate isomerase
LPGVTLAQIREGIHSGTLEQSLNLLPFAAGEMLMVDAGTVHAIWPGSIILETQQNCDVTYRMYDYGRPRELHIEKSLEAIKLDTRSGKVPPTTLPDRTVLVASGYFRVERIPVSGTRLGSTLPSPGESTPGLAYLFAAAGSGQIISTDANPAFPPVALPPRGIVAIPATSPAFAVEDLGNLDLIRITPSSPNPLE